jgi:uncharacterized protein (UPF0332 family)
MATNGFEDRDASAIWSFKMAVVRLDRGLIDVANALVAGAIGAQQEAYLRRAISTAYYALFHALCDLCAAELLPNALYWETVTPLYRSLDHAETKRFFNRCSSGVLLGETIAEIAEAFNQLQEERHMADYDPRPLQMGVAAVSARIKEADAAIAKLLALDKSLRLMLAVNLVAKERARTELAEPDGSSKKKLGGAREAKTGKSKTPAKKPNAT